MTSQVAVIVRLAPLKETEVWRRDEDGNLEGTDRLGQPVSYNFDNVYAATSQNGEIFQSSVADLVSSAVDGYNVTIAAYGQSGSGKTHTLLGSSREEGLVLHSLRHALEQCQNSTRQYLFSLQCIEVYNEKLFDMLSNESRALEIYENEGTVVVRHAREVEIRSINDAENYLNIAIKKRRQAETALNSHSSRSHIVFKLLIESCEHGAEWTTSRLMLVDLAGSENAKTAGAVGSTAQEGGSINKSLLALSNIISGLAEQRKQISYRNSKLTRILKDALGGNSKLLMICCIRPDKSSETASTINFARNAKKVQNVAVKNIGVNAADGRLAAVLGEMEELKKRLKESEQQKEELKKNGAETQSINERLKLLAERFVGNDKENVERRERREHRRHSIGHFGSTSSSLLLKKKPLSSGFMSNFSPPLKKPRTAFLTQVMEEEPLNQSESDDFKPTNDLDMMSEGTRVSGYTCTSGRPSSSLSRGFESIIEAETQTEEEFPDITQVEARYEKAMQEQHLDWEVERVVERMLLEVTAAEMTQREMELEEARADVHKRWKTETADLKQQLQSMSERRDSERATVENLEMKLAEALLASQVDQKTIARLQTTMSLNEPQLAASEQRVSELKKDLERLTNEKAEEAKRAELLLHSSEAAHETETAEMKLQLDELKRDMEEKEAKLAEATQKLEKAEEKTENLAQSSKQVADLQLKLEATQKELLAKKVEMSEHVEKLRKLTVLFNAKQEKADAEEDVFALQRSNRVMKYQLEIFQKEKHSLSSLNQDLNRRLESLAAKESAQNERVRQLRELEAESRDEMKELKEKCRHYRKLYEDEAKMVKELEMSKRVLTKELNELSRAKKQMEDKEKSIQAKIELLEKAQTVVQPAEELKEKKEELAKLTKRLTEAEKQLNEEIKRSAQFEKLSNEVTWLAEKKKLTEQLSQEKKKLREASDVQDELMHKLTKKQQQQQQLGKAPNLDAVEKELAVLKKNETNLMDKLTKATELLEEKEKKLADFRKQKNAGLSYVKKLEDKIKKFEQDCSNPTH